MRNKTKKGDLDYYSLFILGVIFIFSGLGAGIYGLFALGVLFMITGIANKKTWKENKFYWINLNKKQKIIRVIVITIIILLTIIALIFSKIV